MKFKKYLPLGLIILCFLAPMFGAQIALRFQDKIKGNTNEYGKLVIPSMALKVTNTKSLLPIGRETNGPWRLIYVVPKECDAQCQQYQEELIRLHALLREDSSRVQVLSTNIKTYPFNEPGSILLIDPQEHYIMHYNVGSEPSGILKDLMRLLKYSNV